MKALKKALIVGAGIGALYYEQLLAIGFDRDNIFVSDPNVDRIKENCPDINETNIYPNLPDITDSFDIAFVCTPNHLHEKIARFIHSKIIVVEKPGFESPEHWAQAVLDMGKEGTKLMMVDNNSYRTQISPLAQLAMHDNVARIECKWLMWNGVPGAGGWFTTKELAYGGVSRDLLPHMINFAQSLTNGYLFRTLDHVETIKKQFIPDMKWIQDNNVNSWGQTDMNGTYNVDDYAKAVFGYRGIDVVCEAQWSRNAQRQQLSDKEFSDASTRQGKNIFEINIIYKDKSVVKYEFDLCPNEVYGSMIDSFLKLDDFNYEKKIKKDIFVHKAIQ